MNTLVLTENSTLNLAYGASVITFAADNFTPGKSLTITNWSGLPNGGGTDRLLFGTTLTTAPTAPLVGIKFLNPLGFAAGLYDADQLASLEIVPIAPVPEPATVVAAAFLVGWLVQNEWRRRRATLTNTMAAYSASIRPYGHARPSNEAGGKLHAVRVPD